MQLLGLGLYFGASGRVARLSCAGPHPWSGNYIGGTLGFSPVTGGSVATFGNLSRRCILGGLTAGMEADLSGRWIRIGKMRLVSKPDQ